MQREYCAGLRRLSAQGLRVLPKGSGISVGERVWLSVTARGWCLPRCPISLAHRCTRLRVMKPLAPANCTDRPAGLEPPVRLGGATVKHLTESGSAPRPPRGTPVVLLNTPCSHELGPLRTVSKAPEQTLHYTVSSLPNQGLPITVEYQATHRIHVWTGPR